jgi:predicted Zn-dependent protease
MSPSPKTKKSPAGRSAASSDQLLPERELRRIIETVLRLAKSTGADETEVHVDETADSLTRFANNAIHQNVADRGLNVSIRTVVDSRTARATTNRVDEDSLRAAIEASLSLAHSQPKDPHLLPLLGKQRYRKVNRFRKDTAALTPESCSRRRRSCDLAIQNGQVAANSSQAACSNPPGQFTRTVRGVSRDTAEFSITMQENPPRVGQAKCGKR